LRQATHLMAAGRAVSLVPIEQNLTVEEAAILLNVSQPFMTKLLSEGAIKYVMVGSERQICLADLMTYKKQRTIKRREIIRELAQFSQEEELCGEESIQLAG
jgi:excisionase family DNA binding protein